MRKHYVAKRRLRRRTRRNAASRRATAPTSPTASKDASFCRRCRATSFDPYKIINFDKDENRPGGNLLYYLFPTGEFNVAPVEGSANGKLVIDLTMHHLGRLLDADRAHGGEGPRRRASTAAPRPASCATISRSTATRTPTCVRPKLGRRQRQGGRPRHPARRQEHHGHDAFRPRHQHRCRRLGQVEDPHGWRDPRADALRRRREAHRATARSWSRSRRSRASTPGRTGVVPAKAGRK